MSCSNPSDLLGKLAAIQRNRTLYNICFRRAGVGLMFFEGPTDTPEDAGERVLPANWKQYLEVDRYYPSLEEAVDAEYKRLNPQQE